MASREAGAIYISLQLKTAELQAGIASAQKSLRSLSAQAQIAGRNLTAAISVPLGLMARNAVNSFSEFDSAMTKSIAIMGQAGEQMKKQLVDGAMEVSRSTKFSAAQAAEGYYFLAAAGFEAGEALKAMPVIATFATAAHMDLASASDRLVDVLNSVGLASGTSEERIAGLARISSVLAKASVDTNVTIEDLSASLAGPLGGAMRQYGIQVETATAALEAFGSQGIKGRQAGTALSIVIRDLALKSVKNADAFKKYGIAVYDSEGKMRNLIDILKDMDKSLLNVSSKERVKRLQELGFTLKNVGFIQSLLGLSGQLSEWEEANKQMGYDAQLAAKNMESFANQMILVRNELKNLGVAIGGDIAPYLIAIGKAVIEAAQWFQELPKPVRLAVEALGALLIIGPTLLLFFSAIGLGISSLMTIFGGLASAVAVATTALVALPVLFVAITGPLGAIALVGAGVITFWEELGSAVDSFVGWFSENFPVITAVASEVWADIKAVAAKMWQNVVDDFKQKLAPFKEGFEQIKSWSSSAWEFATSAFNLFATALENRFPGLIKLVGELARATKDLANEVINIVAKILNVGADQLIKTGNQIGDLVSPHVDKLNSSVDAIQKLAKIEAEANQYKQQIFSSMAENSGAFTTASDAWNAAANEAQKSIAIEQLIGAQNQSIASEQQLIELKKETNALNNAFADGEDTNDKKRQKAIENRAKALQDLKDTLTKVQNKDSVDDIKESVTEAIKSGVDDVRFEQLSKQLYDSVYKGYVEGAREGIEKAGNTAEAKNLVDQAAKIKAQEAVDDLTTKRIDANTKIAADLAEKEKRAYDESVDHFREIFSNVANASAYDFRDALKEIFIELGANLAAMLSKAFDGTGNGGIANTNESGGLSGSIGGMVQSIGKYFGFGEPTQNADGTTGVGPIANGDEYAQNVGNKGGGITGGDIAAGIETIFAAFAAKDIDKKTKSNEGTGGAVGSGAGAIVGSIFGSPELGAKLGQALGAAIGSTMKWGSQNPETQARHAFANFIEEGFQKLEQVSFFDAKGKLQNMKGKDFNFLEGGRGRFNDGKWADQLNALDAKTRGTFLGLGEALEEILGLTEDVGGQIAFLLSENLGANIDNARLLVMQLGLSMEEMEEKLVAIGKTGEMSWLEVETGLQGIAQAFTPGLVAVGDISGAFDELVQSGGRGIAALKGVRDIGIEAMEAGATSITELQNRLIAAGTNPEQVDALMGALKQRGIETLQQLADVSDRVGGGIVADMNAASGSLAALWADMTEKIAGFTKQLEAIPEEVVSNIRLNVTADVSGDAQNILNSTQLKIPTVDTPLKEHAKGALITGPIGFAGNHVMGEAGPEALLPLDKMSDGRLAVSATGLGGIGRNSGSPVNITVNAPYAVPGAGDEIKKAMMQMEPYLTNRVVNQVIKISKNGGTFGRNL